MRTYLLQTKIANDWVTKFHYRGEVNGRNAKTRAFFALRLYSKLIRKGKKLGNPGSVDAVRLHLSHESLVLVREDFDPPEPYFYEPSFEGKLSG